MRRLKLILLAVVLPLALIGGCVTIAAVKLKPKPKPPRTAKVARGDVVVAVRETGTVEPVKRVEVKSKVPGQLVQLAVEEGDSVTQGQLIARLKVPALEAQRDQIKAQLDGAQARLEQARLAYTRDAEVIESQITQARASLRAAQASVKEAEARRKDAERVYQNTKRLFEDEYVAREDVEVAKTAVDVAVLSRQSAEEQAKQQEVAVRMAIARRPEIALSKARVEEARAALQQARDSLAEIDTHLRDATILAPCNGVVISRRVREGELMTSVSEYSAGAPIVVIGDLATMLVKVDLNEVDISKVHLGQQVKITADALAGRTFRGRVTRLAPASVPADAQQGGGNPGIVKFAVEITVTGNAKDLKPGMTANVEIVCDRAVGTLWVPNDALFQKKGAWYVSIYSGIKNGKPQTKDRQVVKGLANDARTELRSGVKQGETVELGKSGLPPRKTIEIHTGNDGGD